MIQIMLGAVISALTTFAVLSMNLLLSLSVWFQESFTAVHKGQYVQLWIMLTVVVVDRLTVAGWGKQFATKLGVNYN
ncbi:hypothetical protein P4N68_08510 [Corynebacterium felinum]|uniref:ABC-type enterochelin transport system permease subunit n=1 Tax=Corynebacterium felinum TaxID=131318 RepID=A0ABU2B9N9_9CORY|nr:hypothetical protein [Corynebacterium felinum]MDF5821118.1 hypothetical protein [Corynebacterium felinum]MDR7354986.1 ABC-type enterochelin transport system permease subunit [Corynebacterium felinum]